MSSQRKRIGTGNLRRSQNRERIRSRGEIVEFADPDGVHYLQTERSGMSWERSLSLAVDNFVGFSNTYETSLLQSNLTIPVYRRGLFVYSVAAVMEAQFVYSEIIFTT